MAERLFSPDLLQAIAGKQYVLNERGFDILVKPIPDDERPGAMDPRLLKITLPVTEGIKGFILSLTTPIFVKSRSPRRITAFMRSHFMDIKSVPITADVTVRRGSVQTDETEVPIRIYRRAAGNDADKCENLPVLFYIHGGGFAAGSPDIVEEMVKKIVSLSGCVAVQADYRLAPENPFPASLNDCWEVLKWIYKNSREINGDRKRICIAGDSAGGNLATVCAMRDRDEGAGMVKAQVLMYPVLNMAGKEDDNYRWSLNEFKILKEHRKPILFRINAMRPAGKGVLGCVLGAKDESQPYLSPYLGSLGGMPPCLILCGEFDSLRLDSEAYARKLKAAGVMVRMVRYLGMAHAFAEWIGAQPQAEDCMAEISRFMDEFV